MRALTRRITVLGLLLLAFFLAKGVAFADPIQPDDMFFAPSSMVEDVYPIQPLTGGDGTTPWTAVWTGSDILTRDPGRVDVTITGVEILPVLVENPSLSSEEGEYTDAELAAINVSNYQTYYLRYPGTDVANSGTDYAADLTNNILTVQLAAPSLYAVRVKTTSRSAPSYPLEERNYIYSEFAGDFLGEIGGGPRDKVGAHRKVIALPAKDIYVVSTFDLADNGFNLAANSNLLKQGRNVCKATSLLGAINCVCAKSTFLGRELSVTLVGHGAPGAIKIGNQVISNGFGATMTPAQFGQAINPCANAVTLFSCSTKAGPAGAQFYRDMANGIRGPVNGWTTTVTSWPNYVFRGRAYPGFFDVGAGGKKGSIVPEPVGGVSLDPQLPGSSGSDAGLLAGAMAAALAGAFALGGGVWYARRRRVRP